MSPVERAIMLERARARIVDVRFPVTESDKSPDVRFLRLALALEGIVAVLNADGERLVNQILSTPDEYDDLKAAAEVYAGLGVKSRPIFERLVREARQRRTVCDE
jgi:hypothetical protein